MDLNNKPKVISLFSGAGGLDIGFEQLVTGDTTRNTMNESRESLWIQDI